LVNKYNFLIVSKEAWGDTRWARKQWLPYALSKREDVNKVLYLDRHAAWWRGEKSHGLEQHGKVHVIQKALCVPLERVACVRDFNRKRVANGISSLLHGRGNWVSIFYHPYDFAMVSVLQQKTKVVFDWTEDWAVFHANDEMKALQEKCVKHADIVLTVTQALYKRAVAWRGSDAHVYHVPNATALAIQPIQSEPKALAHIAKPRIGFVGHAGPWFDAKLVRWLSEKRKDWQWVMIGGASDASKQVLGGQSNIHWLGTKQPQELLSYMQHCDVLVAPYIAGIQGDATKLYDYLVAQKPIIATACETAEHLQPWVTMCKTEQGWLQALDASLNAPSQHTIANDAAMQKHQWPARAEQVMRIVQGAA